MRPVKCRGLPIILLHPAFTTYLSLSKKALPATSEARTALRVARALCDTMPNYFETEDARTDAFLQATRPLFGQWKTAREVTWHGATALTRTDIIISVNGSPVLLMEVQNGKEGDAYMQASRRYEIVTEASVKTNQDFLARGAPLFMACLNGQSFTLNNRHITEMVRADEELRIAGAFKDGMQIVVEPLSYNLLYPDSRREGRMMELARNLFALYSCLDLIAPENERCGFSSPGAYSPFALKILPSPDPPAVSAPGCPRVFPELRNLGTNRRERLEFVRPRKDLWETADGTIDYLNLIYDAKLGGAEVFAKVVLHPYGKDVHTHLAAQHMAPQLYGTSNLEDLGSVVVMELLKDGWMTLFDYRENRYRNSVIPEGPRRLLLQRMEVILVRLESEGMVHGDFRMANIMLKLGEEERALLIDFDWAGQAELVRYPVSRNDGYGYPGMPGGLISAGDDRQLYETWKNQLWPESLPLLLTCDYGVD
jgi:hypothetical protein